jgi:hypothetical protein
METKWVIKNLRSFVLLHYRNTPVQLKFVFSAAFRYRRFANGLTDYLTW